FCRARRVDMWLAGDSIMLDASFQDSASTEEGDSRLCVHEYSIKASLDRATKTLVAIEATPHILPFAECPYAVRNITTLIGRPAQVLPEQDSIQRQKDKDFTHMHDAISSIGAVSMLIRHLPSK